MTKEYKELFKFIDDTVQKQKAQKKRGLNNYNMVNVVRKATHEVGMHSNVIYSLINPKGEHYQDDLFLNIFIEEVLKISDFGNSIEVQAEEQTSENRRIDFTIKSDKYYIGIEMKINAKDLAGQIFDYNKDLEDKAKKDNNQIVKIYYLTKHGKDASEESKKSVQLTLISFEQHILNWIDKCQNEVRNITNLNEAFENYKNIVKKLLKQYKGKTMNLTDEIVKNNEYLKLITEIDMFDIKGTVLFNFFESLDDKFESKNIQKDYKFSQNKCKEFFYPKEQAKRFGKIFDVNFGNDYYLLIIAATDLLHYGVVKKVNDNVIAMDEGNSLFIEANLEYRSWKSMKWYSYSKKDWNINEKFKENINLLTEGTPEYNNFIDEVKKTVELIKNKT